VGEQGRIIKGWITKPLRSTGLEYIIVNVTTNKLLKNTFLERDQLAQNKLQACIKRRTLLGVNCGRPTIDTNHTIQLHDSTSHYYCENEGQCGRSGCINERRISAFSIWSRRRILLGRPLCLCRTTGKHQLEEAVTVIGASIDDDSTCPLYGSDIGVT
jgi:hypothetical protein